MVVPDMGTSSASSLGPFSTLSTIVGSLPLG